MVWTRVLLYNFDRWSGSPYLTLHFEHLESLTSSLSSLTNLQFCKKKLTQILCAPVKDRYQKIETIQLNNVENWRQFSFNKIFMMKKWKTQTRGFYCRHAVVCEVLVVYVLFMIMHCLCKFFMSSATVQNILFDSFD